MNREEIIQKLIDLKSQINQIGSFEFECEEADKELSHIKSKVPSKVLAFDKEHKEKYITEKVGKEPVAPKGLAKLTKSKEYERELSEFKKNRKEAEEQYLKDFANERIALFAQEQLEIEENSKQAQKKYEEAVNLLESTKTAIKENNIVNDKFKTPETLTKLIDYFNEQRADSIKEAINLYYEEENRELLMKQIAEQGKQIEEAKKLARQAIELASSAIDSANAASESAQEVAEIATKALEEACKAQAATIALM